MRVLLIRFSSFGDVVQAMAAVSALQQNFPGVEVDWLTRQDFASLVKGQCGIRQVYGLQRKDGLSGLIRLARQLRENSYTHIYDAHNNLRSHLTCQILQTAPSRPQVIHRSKERWKQLMLFKFRRDLYERPLIAQKSYVTPLQVWGVRQWQPAPYFVPPELPPSRLAEFLPPGYSLKSAIALVPSTAHELKSWPEAHWQTLIESAAQQKFILLGGPHEEICARLAQKAPHRVLNLAGQLSLNESCAVVGQVAALVAADTGLLHIADAMGHPAVGLYGPVMCCYPQSPSTRVLEVDLPCRPCSRIGEGYCTHPELKKCLTTITPSQVMDSLNHLLPHPLS